MSAYVSYWKVEHRSGAYIAKTVEIAQTRVLVEIAAVLRHPLQGDLHHPYRTDVALFHERKAAAYREKVWLPLKAAEPYNGPVPDYDASLRAAWEEQVNALRETAEAKRATDPELAAWADESLKRLEQLRLEYWKQS